MDSDSPFLGKLSRRRMQRAIEAASLTKVSSQMMVCVEETGLATCVGDNGIPRPEDAVCRRGGLAT
jgi:hypothetical protein